MVIREAMKTYLPDRESGKSFNASYKNGKIIKVTAYQVDCQI